MQRPRPGEMEQSCSGKGLPGALVPAVGLGAQGASAEVEAYQGALPCLWGGEAWGAPCSHGEMPGVATMGAGRLLEASISPLQGRRLPRAPTLAVALGFGVSPAVVGEYSLVLAGCGAADPEGVPCRSVAVPGALPLAAVLAVPPELSCAVGAVPGVPRGRGILLRVSCVRDKSASVVLSSVGQCGGCGDPFVHLLPSGRQGAVALKGLLGWPRSQGCTILLPTDPFPSP